MVVFQDHLFLRQTSFTLRNQLTNGQEHHRLQVTILLHRVGIECQLLQHPDEADLQHGLAWRKAKDRALVALKPVGEAEVEDDILEEVEGRELRVRCPTQLHLWWLQRLWTGRRGTCSMKYHWPHW